MKARKGFSFLMEQRILKLVKAAAWLILMANVVFCADEFIAPESQDCTIVSYEKLLNSNGEIVHVLQLSNNTEVVVESAIQPPVIGQSATAYFTPWFKGVKAVKFDIQTASASISEQWVGNPNTPRIAILILTFFILMFCVLTLLSDKYSMGSLFFAIILAGVRFWTIM